MVAVESGVTITSHVHCLSSGFGLGKWNYLGREDELSCGVAGTKRWL